VQQRRTGYTLEHLLRLYDLSRSTYFGWFDGAGNLRPPTERKASTSTLRSVLATEEQAVVNYRLRHKEVGYRKLTWMMIDENIAYLSESAVYQILLKHHLLYGWNKVGEPAKKEYTQKPQFVHHHWHTDIAYIKVAGVFYFLIMVLDGYSRFLLGWDLMTDMLGRSIEDVIAKVKEKYPHCKPMLIHDNGSQFVSHDFKRLVTTLDIQSVRTRRNHPETNGKIERLNGIVKSEAIRPNAPQSYVEAWEVINEYVYQYNHQRLHAGIKFMRPADMFFGREIKISKERAGKLQAAKVVRRETNLESRCSAVN
jgi:transposase InsO family protein